MVFKFLKLFSRNNQSRSVEPPKVVVPAFESSVELILNCNLIASGETKEGTILYGNSPSIFYQYLQAVEEIQLQTESAIISVNDQSRANSVIQIAMAQLENEFRVILISLPRPTDNNPSKSSTVSSSITDSSLSHGDYGYIEIDPLKMDDLRNIAERMNSAGCLDKCVEVYKSVRKTFIHESCRKLGMQNVSINDIRSLDWEALDAKIEQWILVARTCVRYFFAGEQTICEQIFGGLGSAIDDTCFLEVVKDPVTQLLTSVKAISICTSSPSRRPEKLFKILDLQELVSELLHDFDIIFQSKSSESIRIQAAELLTHLAGAPSDILAQFLTTMLHEQSNILDSTGSIIGLTTYVMSYIMQVTSCEKKLTKLIVTNPSTLQARRTSSDGVTFPDMDFPELDERTPLAVHLIWIIEILQFKLEAKSKCLEDASLAQLFMMNNVHYIVLKIVECSELLEMVEDDYLEKLAKNVERAVAGYQRSTWDRILHCFRDEGLNVSGSLSSGVSKSALKGRLKTFNAIFEEVHQTQASWLVPDKNLREMLRFSTLKYLIPAYRSFLELSKRHVRSRGHQEEYIKYSVEDLEAVISNFFEGHLVQ